MKLYACIIICLTALPACISERMTTGHPLEMNKISSFEKGKTTITDVVATIGVPQEVSPSSTNRNGDCNFTYFTYAYADGTSETFFLPAGPINLILYSLVKGKVEGLPPIGSHPLAEWTTKAKYYQFAVLGFDDRGYLQTLSTKSQLPEKNDDEKDDFSWWSILTLNM